MSAVNKKQTLGRRKIEMKKIASDASRLQVCFSKRKAGLFKKANDLTILCGAELAILVFSPGGKPHSFSHPSLDLISSRFLNSSFDDHQPISSTSTVTTTDGQSKFDLRSTQKYNNTHILNKRQESGSESIEKERRRKVVYDEMLRSTWLSDESMATFDLSQLDFIRNNLASIKEQLHKVLINFQSNELHRRHHVVGSTVEEFSNGVAAGGYDQGEDSFMAPPDVMNSCDVPNYYFPTMYYDHQGGCQQF